MKTAYAFFSATLLLSGSALGQPQDHSHGPPPKLAGKGMDSCKADIRKFCATANLKQECLVAHWSRISGNCQAVLAMPMRDGGDGGN